MTEVRSALSVITFNTMDYNPQSKDRDWQNG